MDSQAECCPLTCSVNKSTEIGYPWKNNGKRRSAYEQQSSALPVLKKERPWYRDIHSTVLQQNLKRLHTAFDNFFQGRGYPKAEILVFEDLNIKGLLKRCQPKKDENGQFPSYFC